MLSCSCCQLSVSVALKRVGGAAADGMTGVRLAGARVQDTGQRDQEPDRPGSHARRRATAHPTDRVESRLR